MEESAKINAYVGFWARAFAALVDSIALIIVIWPVLYMVYGADYFSGDADIKGNADIVLNWVAPALIVIALWVRYQATPGKLLIGARIVDATTGAPATSGQYILRYIGYYLALLPVGLGILWVAIDGRKQGWHDKLARTIVVKSKAGLAPPDGR